jgi:mRNA interferase MazF
MNQYDIYLVNLVSSTSSDVKKTRTCLIISPDEMNQNLDTLIIVPLTFQSSVYPTRVPLTFQGKPGYIVLDQIRTVNRSRLVKKLGKIGMSTAVKVKSLLSEMLIE